jgi:hypothetical protein
MPQDATFVAMREQKPFTATAFTAATPASPTLFAPTALGAQVVAVVAILPTLAFSFLTPISTSLPHLCTCTAPQPLPLPPTAFPPQPQRSVAMATLLLLGQHASSSPPAQLTLHPLLALNRLQATTPVFISIHLFAKSAATQLLVPLLPVNKMSPMPTSKESRPTRVQVCLTSTYRHWHHIWYNKTNLPQDRQTWPLECWKAFS